MVTMVRAVTLNGYFQLTRRLGINPQALLRQAELDAAMLANPEHRIPIAILLVVGGFLSFLPVLGIWMLPLGLLLFAQDVPPLQKPMALGLGWIERKWLERERAKLERERARSAQ